jgi:hypothetical protein
VRFRISLEDRQRLEQKLGRPLPPPNSNAFDAFLEALKLEQPELAEEVTAALKLIGVPDAVSVQAGKARENARFAGFFQKFFMKSSNDGPVVHKVKVQWWTAALFGVLFAVGLAALLVKPAPKSNVGLGTLLGNGDGSSATGAPDGQPGSQPGAKPGQPGSNSGQTSNVTSQNAAPSIASSPGIPQDASSAGSAAIGSPNASGGASRLIQPANGGSSTAGSSPRVRKAAPTQTNYVVPTSDGGFSTPGAVARSGSSAGSGSVSGSSAISNPDELDASGSRTPSGTRFPSQPVRLVPRGGAPLPSLTARPISVTGSSRPLVPRGSLSIQSVGAAPGAIGAVGVSASSTTRALASGMTVTSSDEASPASGLNVSSSEASADRASGLNVVSSEAARAQVPVASGGIGIQSVDARAPSLSPNAVPSPQASGGIGFSSATPPVRAQDGFPGAGAGSSAQAAPGLPGTAQTQPAFQPGPIAPLETVLPGLSVGLKLEASTSISVVAVEQGVAPVVAVTKNPPCGKDQCAPVVWIGQALLGPDRRIWVSFDQASYEGKTYSLKAQALGVDDLRPGLSAEVTDEAPTLVSDLLRGGIGAFSDYLTAQLGAKTTTLIPGGGATESGSVPDLVNFFGGRAAGLFSIPSDSKALVRVARVAPDSRLIVLYGIAPVLGGQR